MKRFWKEAKAEAAEDGWTVRLDGRPLRTPAKAPFLAPTRALAEAAAAEWAAQEAEVKPAEMPFTRAVNTAIDRTRPEWEAVAAAVAAYGGSDLLCYRAEGPEALRARQDAHWNPLLHWAEEAHGARLVTASGIVHRAQDEAALARLEAAVRRFDAFGLTALYDLTALSGSLVIALAVAQRRLDAGEGWRLSRLDESWNEEFWGVDDLAAATAARKARDFEVAARMLALLEA